jgi:hypothetical protein
MARQKGWSKSMQKKYNAARRQYRINKKAGNAVGGSGTGG